MRTNLLMFVVLAIVFQANIFQVSAQGTCSVMGKPCLWDEWPKTQAACSQIPTCAWCANTLSLPQQKKCQTVDRSCLVPFKWEIPGPTNEATCQAAGGIYCNGDGEQVCIYSEPAFGDCFKPGGLIACADTSATTEEECHLAGCVFCGDWAISRRAGKCWQKPTASNCDASTSCCLENRCMSGTDPDSTTCANKGCHICQDDTGTKYCNFGEGDLCPECEGLPTCPTGNVEECAGGTTKELCEDLCCEWCTENDAVFCKRSVFADQCNGPAFLSCEVSATDQNTCLSHGCIWCGEETTTTKCIVGTDCVSCGCANRVECCASTEEACGLRGCMWCNEATDFKCMYVDAGGLTQAGEWTQCTRTCGGGSQWKFDETCTGTHFLSCPRVHRTCNEEPCPLDICDEGERNRYVESGSCCASHTASCGRNPYNEFPPQTSAKNKRVVGGLNIGQIENWPFLAVIYVNLTKKCTGTLLCQTHVITNAGCVSGSNAEEIEVNLDQYDRSTEAGVIRKAVSYEIFNEIAIIVLESPVTYSDNVQPICLPGGEIPLQDTDCIVAGWGQTTMESSTDCVLETHAAAVRVLPFGLCEMTWGGDVNLTDDYFCAGIPEGGVDACSGDEGAPLMCQRCDNCGWFLYGVATEHIGCGGDRPTVYAKITSYEDWIVNSQNVPVLDPGPYSCD